MAPVSTRKPIVGEVVTTPNGDGTVVLVVDYENHPRPGTELAAYLRSRMGRDYAQLYFHAEVEVDGELKVYACWDLQYDAERDPEEAPWREPPSD